MTETQHAGSLDRVKAELENLVAKAMADLAIKASDGGQRALELTMWSHLLVIGKALLSYALTLRCLQSTLTDLERRGLGRSDISIRSDASYQAKLTTTVGAVVFPMCAYRDFSGPLVVTRTPARADVLACYRRCRSSELCVEWEARLGAELPFRTAQGTLAYFSHGAVHVEDTTLARHMVTIGSAMTRDWLYRTPEQIAEFLETRATRDLETNRPIVYASSDAVALRRYVDDTWAAEWKMANGIRLWCIDRVSGATIHLGGEYTFGDCQVVEAAVLRLIESGHLPRDGRYPSVHAQIVFITDGMPWLEDRIINQFADAIAILDLYHVLEHVAAYAATLHRKGTTAAKNLYKRAMKALLGDARPEARENTSPRTRKGHTKRRRTQRPAASFERLPADREPPAAALLRVVNAAKVKSKRTIAARDALLSYTKNNAHRMDYTWFRSLGYQIGSGAMESLHRNAAQSRLKRPGARWLPDTAEAVFSLRMLALVEREEEFWSQPGLTQWLRTAFAATAKKDPARAATTP